MSTSLEQAAAEAAPVRLSMLPDPAQLELLRGADGSLPRGAIHIARTRGRPKGARNKRSKKIADYFVGKYGDPLDVLGQVMTTPLKQLVEVLREADGSEEREARLLEIVDLAEDYIRSVRGNGTDSAIDKVTHLIDRIADLTKELSGRPGKLALDALALQINTTRAALEYVHGKQPVSVEVSGKADLVVFAPELLRQHGVDPTQLEAAIAERGLEAFDADDMRLLPPADVEFTEVDEEAEE